MHPKLSELAIKGEKTPPKKHPKTLKSSKTPPKMLKIQ
jgi:hypothetical protein